TVPFADDGSVQFGTDGEFWVQWCQYIGTRAYPPAGSPATRLKLMAVEYAHPGSGYEHSDGEIVVYDGGPRQAPIACHGPHTDAMIGAGTLAGRPNAASIRPAAFGRLDHRNLLAADERQRSDLRDARRPGLTAADLRGAPTPAWVQVKVHITIGP